MEKVVVVGSGGHAASVSNIIEKEGKYRIVGFIDDTEEPGTEVYGYPILGNVQDIRAIGITKGIIAIGENWSRMQVVDRVKEVCPEFEYITTVHPWSDISRGACFGEGTVIHAGAVLGPETGIGRHCTVMGQTIVAHGSVLGDYVNIHPGVVTGGNVRVGKLTTVGMGSTVIQNLTIGENTVIGAGSTVVKDIPTNVIAFGSPCKPVRERKAGEGYL